LSKAKSTAPPRTGSAQHDENCVYDAVGNMLTATFSDYTPITALNMPNVKYAHIETPSPHSYSGAKGMGEGGGPHSQFPLRCRMPYFSSGILITDSLTMRTLCTVQL